MSEANCRVAAQFAKQTSARAKRSDRKGPRFLDVEEMETRFGWRSGRYFIENARTWESLHSGTVPETQSLSVDMHIFVQWTPQIASRVEVSGVNASSFCDIATNAPPAWLWRREWNLMRVTRRGTEQPSDWVSCDEAAYGFIIRVR